MLPSIGVPTTAGTGSEAQSYALISDSETHAKMACGDPKAAFRVAILDPDADRDAAASGDGDRRLRRHLARRRVVRDDAGAARSPICSRATRGGGSSGTTSACSTTPDDLAARGAMLLGAHEAGIAIEQSMLGATHACANPLTARYGTTHGVAIAVMLPHVVRWNARARRRSVRELLVAASRTADTG